MERPDINALLDAINEDHAGNRVVRGSDRSTLTTSRSHATWRKSWSQFGIRKGMKENDVRDALKELRAKAEAARKTSQRILGPAAAHHRSSLQRRSPRVPTSKGAGKPT